MNHIRIISPSGAIDPAYVDLAADRLRSWGYEVSEGASVRTRWGRFAATDDERLADIQAAFADETVDIILCARGGYGLQRIIDRVDIEPLLRRRHKPLLVGFSDITELHMLLNQHDIPTLHGLMCKHLATLDEDSIMIYAWRAAVAGENMCFDLPLHPLNRYGEVEGRIIGGNLSVLYGLQGTAYGLTHQVPPAPHQAPKAPHQSALLTHQSPAAPLLFIEDIAERHYHIDRMMNNLRMSGVLERIGGLIVGQFSDCQDDDSMNESIYETIRRMVEPYDYPVLMGFPAGHVETNMPILMGTPVRMTVTEDKVKILSIAPHH